MKLCDPKRGSIRFGGFLKKAFVPPSAEGDKTNVFLSEPNLTIVLMSLDDTSGVSAGRISTESGSFRMHHSVASSTAQFKPIRSADMQEAPSLWAASWTVESLLVITVSLTTDAFRAAKTASSMVMVNNLRSCGLSIAESRLFEASKLFTGTTAITFMAETPSAKSNSSAAHLSKCLRCG